MNVFGKVKLCGLIAVLSLLGATLYACGSPTSELDTAQTEAKPTYTRVAAALHSDPDEADRVELVYFHRSQRCSSCLRAEDLIKRTIETYFRDELARGKLVFKVLNVQDKANAAMVRKYGAAGSSLFINEIKDGRDNIEEVTDIWFMLSTETPFIKAVKSEIEKHLRG